MGHTGTGYTAVTIVIAAGLLLAMVPVGQAATLATDGPIPCTAVSLSPPDVAIGECNPSPLSGASSNGAPEWVDATMDESDVTVTWGFDHSEANATGFVVYRGHTPYTLTRLVTTGNQTYTYTDTNALASTEAVWYAVATLTDDGSVKMSSPTLVEPH